MYDQFGPEYEDKELEVQTQSDMRESLRLEGINDLTNAELSDRGLIAWLKKLLSQI